MPNIGAGEIIGLLLVVIVGGLITAFVAAGIWLGRRTSRR